MFLPLQPNYVSPMTERLEWLTDVQVSSNGTEIRRQLRQLPRSSLSYSFFLQGSEASSFRNILRNYQGKVVQAPWWPGAICTTTTGVTHATGNDAINDFAVGEQAVYFQDFNSFELVDVVAYNGSSVTTSTSAKAWPIGTKLVPVRDFYLAYQQMVEAPTAGLATGSVTLDQVVPYYADDNGDIFDPLTDEPNRATSVSEDWTRLVEELDFHTGSRYRDDYADQSTVNRSFEYVLTNKPKTSAFRAWLHYFACGRQNTFEIPSWQCDFQVIAQPGVMGGSSRFDVMNTGNATILPRPLKLRLSGTRQTLSPLGPVLPWVAYPTVTNIIALNPTTERMFVSSLGSNTDFVIHMASWVDVVRLDSDAIEIAHLSGEVARVQLPVKTLRIP